LLLTDPDFRAEVRRLVLTDELLTIPEEVNELVNPVWEFVATQREHFEIPRWREEILREHSTNLASVFRATSCPRENQEVAKRETRSLDGSPQSGRKSNCRLLGKIKGAYGRSCVGFSLGSMIK
jgi:hypothetical protein